MHPCSETDGSIPRHSGRRALGAFAALSAAKAPLELSARSGGMFSPWCGAKDPIGSGKRLEWGVSPGRPEERVPAWRQGRVTAFGLRREPGPSFLNPPCTRLQLTPTKCPTIVLQTIAPRSVSGPGRRAAATRDRLGSDLTAAAN